MYQQFNRIYAGPKRIARIMQGTTQVWVETTVTPPVSVTFDSALTSFDSSTLTFDRIS